MYSNWHRKSFSFLGIPEYFPHFVMSDSLYVCCLFPYKAPVLNVSTCQQTPDTLIRCLSIRTADGCCAARSSSKLYRIFRTREGDDSNDHGDVEDDWWEGLKIRCWLEGEVARLSRWQGGHMTCYFKWPKAAVNWYPFHVRWCSTWTLPQTVLPSLPTDSQYLLNQQARSQVKL